MSMKICHATDFLPGYHNVWGGAELAAANLIDILQDKNNIQVVLSTKPEKIVDKLFKFHSIPVLNDYFGKFAEIIKLWVFDPLAFSRVLKILKEDAPDVLHLHNFRTLSFSVVAAAKRLNIPIVFSIYDNWCLCPNHTLITKTNNLCKTYHGLACLSCTYSHKKPSAFFRKAFFNHFLKKIDTFIVLSHTMSDVLENYGIPKSKIRFLPLPLSRDTWNSELSQKNEIKPALLLFCGWVSPHKGLEVLVKAMPNVIKAVPRARLNVIETGVDLAYKDKILEFIRENRLEEHISFLGKKNNAEVQKYLQESELVVVPEQWGIAWPIFLTEAMFAKKSVVASRIGDIPFFIKDGINGYTVDPKSPDEFSRQIIYSLSNNNLMCDFGMQSKQRIIEICNNENIYNELMNIYKGSVCS